MARGRTILLPANSAVIAIAFAELPVLRAADERAVAHPHGLAIIAGAPFGEDRAAHFHGGGWIEAAHRSSRSAQHLWRDRRRGGRSRHEQRFDQQKGPSDAHGSALLYSTALQN